MQPTTLLLALAAATGVVADLHRYGYCTSVIQPVGQSDSCNRGLPVLGPARRDLPQSRMDKRDQFGNNEAATRAACAAYKNRHTGTKQWDSCPDCHLAVAKEVGSEQFCAVVCVSEGYHIGGDEFLYYCKQNGATGSDAYP